jgi:hypothetical protein
MAGFFADEDSSKPRHSQLSTLQASLYWANLL